MGKLAVRACIFSLASAHRGWEPNVWRAPLRAHLQKDLRNKKYARHVSTDGRRTVRRGHRTSPGRDISSVDSWKSRTSTQQQHHLMERGAHFLRTTTGTWFELGGVSWWCQFRSANVNSVRQGVYLQELNILIVPFITCVISLN